MTAATQGCRRETRIMKLRAHVLAACIAAVLTSVSAHAAGSPDSVNLIEVYKRALQNDPIIREAEANRLATLENKPQARAGLLPQLTAAGSYVKGDTDFTRGQFFTQEDDDPT